MRLETTSLKASRPSTGRNKVSGKVLSTGGMMVKSQPSARPPAMVPGFFRMCFARLFPRWVVAFVALVGAVSLPAQPAAAESFRWSVQYLIDNSRTILDRPQSVAPRHVRGLALSPDGTSLYAGYAHGFANGGEVRRLAVDTADFDRATLAVLRGPRGRAIATDDRGRVYIADENAVLVYDAALGERQLEVAARACEGLALAREKEGLALYTGNRQLGTVTRWILAENGARIVAATPAGYGSGGVLAAPGATDVCGIEIDAAGNLWIADSKGGRVIRITPDGRGWLAVPVATPCDIAIEGDSVFITRASERGITMMDSEMNTIGTLDVPWDVLELSPRGHPGAMLSGIAAWPGRGFFVGNEAGKTAARRSIYGATDERSDFIGGRLFRDAFGDDNDPILRAMRVLEAGEAEDGTRKGER